MRLAVRCILPRLALFLFTAPALIQPAFGAAFNPPPDLEYRSGVEFGRGGGRPLRMEILRPRAAARESLPVLVFIHGGGWRQGDRFNGLSRLIPFARAGYFCASVEYRLSGEAIFPAQIEDVKCAIRFLRAHRRPLGIDPDRIGVWGTSAGGHLAALLGTTGGIGELEGNGGWAGRSSRVQAVCDWFGPADLLNAHGEVKRAISGPGSPEALLLGGAVAERRNLAALASPITHVSPDDPPFLIMHGELDQVVPCGQSEALYEALKQAGVKAYFAKIPGAGHGFANQEEHLRAVAAFFETYLGE